MAVYGAFDAIVSMRLQKSTISCNEQLCNFCVPKESFSHCQLFMPCAVLYAVVLVIVSSEHCLECSCNHKHLPATN